MSGEDKCGRNPVTPSHVTRNHVTRNHETRNPVTTPGSAAAENHVANAPPGVANSTTNIFRLYEDLCGVPIPGPIVDDLKEAEELYPVEWIKDAFVVAAEQNARNWAYPRSILQRWAREGKDNGRTPGSNAKRGADPGGYQGPTPGKYDHLNTRIDMDA